MTRNFLTVFILGCSFVSVMMSPGGAFGDEFEETRKETDAKMQRCQEALSAKGLKRLDSKKLKAQYMSYFVRFRRGVDSSIFDYFNVYNIKLFHMFSDLLRKINISRNLSPWDL